MRLELTLTEEAVELPASQYLNSLKDEFFDNPEKGLRHPLGLYNLSATKAIKSIQRIIDIISSYSCIIKDNHEKSEEFNHSITDATLSFLYSISEHIDACDNIVTLVNEVITNKKKNQLRDFKENIKLYRNHVLTQTNHIKHRQSKIRIIKLTANQKHSFGYFIESATNDKGVGPDPIIHKGQNTAFSYSREMRLATIALYFISKSLVAILNNNKPAPKISNNTKSEPYSALLNKILTFDAPYFPDEYEKPSCIIRKSNQTYKISCGEKSKEKPPYINASFQVVTVADGVTHSFGMPYMNNQF